MVQEAVTELRGSAALGCFKGRGVELEFGLPADAVVLDCGDVGHLRFSLADDTNIDARTLTVNGQMCENAYLFVEHPMGAWQDIATAPRDRPILAQDANLPEHDPKRCMVVFSNHDNPTADYPGWHIPYSMEARVGLTHWTELPERRIRSWLED